MSGSPPTGPKARPGFPARTPLARPHAVQQGVQAAWPDRPGSVVSPQAHLQLARVDAQRQVAAATGDPGIPGLKRTGGASGELARGASRRPPPIPAGSSRPAAVQDARSQMVQRLRDHTGIGDPRVLAALGGVWRHRFVDSALAAQAYEDTSLPIGHGQTISKPSVVARMIELLAQGEAAQAARGLGRTLEIGTGCGYQAAVLCRLATEVFSVERLQALHEAAKQRLSDQRPRNLRLVYGDGMRGHPPNAPYASIISAAGGDHVPQAWLDQLAVGGRLVAPVVSSVQGAQTLKVIDRTATGYRERTLEAVHFVPLKSGAS